ncbi:iron-siderophore ABC transporter substrate-binding protein [Devosia naphthalenivorans]|uniref:iron-siderophore ABC transporter substrate-binding protein n=1 Tax=Devosia naphthalenivorans TaxID=2082392 RepID=UPI0013B06647|nr:iron-siderophore ABC transporter substrate-binding protein [Devosia naphthalenivorans]
MKLSIVVGLVALLGLSSPVLSQEAFPVTITHGLGETIIPDEPQRIVTIGWITQDVVLALGEVPVGIPLQEWGGDENGVLPWVADAIAELGGELPTRLNPQQISYEQILSLRPDLILAPYSDLDAEKYRRLSAIAPTVAWATGPWSGTWQDVTTTVGQALGKTPEAETLVAGVEEKLAAVAQAHPEFSGRSFTFGYADPGSNGLGIYVASDPRVQMLQELGLVLSPGAAALPSDGAFYVPVSFENLGSVDADVLITWHGDQSELEALNANPLFARFAPVASGRHLAVVDRSFAIALSAPSVLSIPWSVDRLVPLLSALLG